MFSFSFKNKSIATLPRHVLGMLLYQRTKPTVPQCISNLIAQSQWEERSICSRWWLVFLWCSEQIEPSKQHYHLKLCVQQTEHQSLVFDHNGLTGLEADFINKRTHKFRLHESNHIKPKNHITLLCELRKLAGNTIDTHRVIWTSC